MERNDRGRDRPLRVEETFLGWSRFPVLSHRHEMRSLWSNQSFIKRGERYFFHIFFFQVKNAYFFLMDAH